MKYPSFAGFKDIERKKFISNTGDATATAADIVGGVIAYTRLSRTVGASTLMVNTFKDATATANDIALGKIGFVNGVQLTGVNRTTEIARGVGSLPANSGTTTISLSFTPKIVTSFAILPDNNYSAWFLISRNDYQSNNYAGSIYYQSGSPIANYYWSTQQISFGVNSFTITFPGFPPTGSSVTGFNWTAIK